MKHSYQTELLEQTVVAARARDGANWMILDLRCNPENIHLELAARGLADVEYRQLGFRKIHPDYARWGAVDFAAKSGWHWDLSHKKWFPLEEALPPLDGNPSVADVALELHTIRYGSIVVKVRVGTREFELNINDMDDDLNMWIRFVQLLDAGGEPHASLADRATAEFIIQNCRDPSRCRFIVNVSNQEFEESIDVWTGRKQLLAQFRSLLSAIADHPSFSHHYVCHCRLSEVDYDRICKEAEAEWADLVVAGVVIDDIEAADQYEAARISAAVPLPRECAREVAELKTALQSFGLQSS